jgi:hypothetical protein
MTPIFRSPFIWALVLCAAASLGQSTDGFEAQIRQGDAALQSGRADEALSAGDAAVRIAPERWDGYALSGRALLALRRYEAAADALSQAIERAPGAQQPALRELRRECLVAESGGPGAPPTAAVPAVPAAPPLAANLAAPAAPAAPAAVAAAAPAPAPVPVERRERRSKSSLVFFSADSPEAAWTDAMGLMWARPWYYPASEVGPFDYPQAQTVCAGLRLLGQQDWRLPTVEEVQRIYEVSSKAFRFSPPKFDPEYGLNDAIKHDAWRVRDFTIDGDTFNANRILIWTSTPGDQPGSHQGVYFGRAYSVDDNVKAGDALHGTRRRMPFQAFVLCVRNAGDEASR